MKPIDKRHLHPSVFLDLMDRLDKALAAHVARFPDLDSEILSGGFVTAMAMRAGELALKLEPDVRKRAETILQQIHCMAKSAKIPLAEGPGPDIKRDAPGVN